MPIGSMDYPLEEFPAQKIVSDIELRNGLCHVREIDTDPQQIPEYKVEMYSDGRENPT